MTPEQRKVLAHIVVDPDAWMAEAEAAHGLERAAEFLKQKVARWQPFYEEAVAKGSYRNRADRDRDEERAMEQRIEAKRRAQEEAKEVQ